jgi:hypothetical protein
MEPRMLLSGTGIIEFNGVVSAPGDDVPQSVVDIITPP